MTKWVTKTRLNLTTLELSVGYRKEFGWLLARNDALFDGGVPGRGASTDFPVIAQKGSSQSPA